MNQQHSPSQLGWQAGSPLSGFQASGDKMHGVEPDLSASFDDMIQVVRRSSRGMLLWLLFCLALGGLYLYRAAPEFVATTQIVLEPRRQVPGASEASAASYGPALDSAQADSQVQVVKSERTLRFVFDTLDLGHDPVFGTSTPGLFSRIAALFPGHSEAGRLSPAQQVARASAKAFQTFSDRVGVRRIGQSYVLEVSFRAPSGALAARLANSVTAAYILDQIEFKAATAQRGAEFLQNRIADIKAEQDIAVDSVKKGIIPDVQFADSDARVVSAAVEPLSKAYPQPVLILLLALIFGLLTGAAFITIRHSLDRRIRSRQQIMRMFGIDCLGVLPRLNRRAAPRAGGDPLFTAIIDEDSSDFAEALRILRTTLLSRSKTPRHIALGVVSWSPGEGRSTVASNLALLIAASRERVVLMDADFRHPALSRAMAPEAPVGLSEALLVPPATPIQLPMVPIDQGLDLVPALGSGQPSNPNIFIGSAEMQQCLLALHGQRDVIIDLPPMRLSSDTQAIGHLLDGVVLLVEVNRTRWDELSEAIRALQASNTHLLGIVLNKMPTSSQTKSSWLRPSARPGRSRTAWR